MVPQAFQGRRMAVVYGKSYLKQNEGSVSPIDIQVITVSLFTNLFNKVMLTPRYMVSYRLKARLRAMVVDSLLGVCTQDLER